MKLYQPCFKLYFRDKSRLIHFHIAIKIANVALRAQINYDLGYLKFLFRSQVINFMDGFQYH